MATVGCSPVIGVSDGVPTSGLPHSVQNIESSPFFAPQWRQNIVPPVNVNPSPNRLSPNLVNTRPTRTGMWMYSRVCRHHRCRKVAEHHSAQAGLSYPAHPSVDNQPPHMSALTDGSVAHSIVTGCPQRGRRHCDSGIVGMKPNTPRTDPLSAHIGTMASTCVEALQRVWRLILGRDHA